MFEWHFDEEDFIKANESEVEDDIFGAIFFQTDKMKYYVDIHRYYYNKRDFGYNLDIYEELEDGGHGECFDSIWNIKSSATLERFKKRAEKLLTEWVKKEGEVLI